METALDLICDVGDDLNGAAAVVTATLLLQNRPVNFTGSNVGITGQALVDETLVMSQIQIGLGAVIGDKYFTVLNGVHRTGVDVDIRVKLLHGDRIASGF
mgnify:CR=1 FL=1